MITIRPAWAPLLLLAVAACGTPPDGVQAIAFLLGPPPPGEDRSVPTAAESGVAPTDLGQARGRCDIDVPARRVVCRLENLPPAGTAAAPLPYQLSFLLWYVPLTAGFDARALDRNPGGHDPDLPPPPMNPPLPRQLAGPVTPDVLGMFERTITAADWPIDRVVGAELTLELPGPPQPRRFVVMDGRVGNLESTSAGAAAPPAPPVPGHQH